MKANKFNQGGIESFLQPTINKNSEKDTGKTSATSKAEDKEAATMENRETVTEIKANKPTRTKKDANPDIDTDRIMRDYLPYLTSKKAKQNKSNRVSYLLTDKAMFTLDSIEKITGFKKNAIINAVLEKEAEKYGYKA